MTGYELGQAVQVQIDLEFSVLMHAGEGVVEHCECTVRMRQTGDAAMSATLVTRIGRALEPHEPRGTCRQRALDAVEVLDREQVCVHQTASRRRIR